MKITERFRVAAIAALWRFMQGINPPLHYVVAFSNGSVPVYRKSKTVPFEKGMSWSLSTVRDKVAKGKEFACAIYSKNSRNESSWAVFDCDDHSGGGAGRVVGDKLLQALKKIAPDSLYLYEESGRGTHLFLFSLVDRSCADWIAFMERIAATAGVTIGAGGCEIQPASDDTSLFGLAMRAPGSFNPATGTVSTLISDNLDRLVEHLLSRQKLNPGFSFPKGEKDIVEYPEESRRQASERSSETDPTGSESKSNETNPEPRPEATTDADAATDYWHSHRQQFGIAKLRTRHNQLSSLNGALFHQFGRTVALEIIQRQYREKSVPTRASAGEHQAEFADLWERMDANWLDSLSNNEKAAHAQLRSDVCREAFKIVRSYAHFAHTNGRPEFPIGRDNLARRLGVTPQYAGRIRAELVTCHVIAETSRYQPHKAASRYAWLLSSDSTTSTAKDLERSSDHKSKISQPMSNASFLSTDDISNSSSSEKPPPKVNELPAPISDEPRTSAENEMVPVAARIYTALSQNGRLTFAELEARVHAPSDTVHLALRQLEGVLLIHNSDGFYVCGAPANDCLVRETIELLAAEIVYKGVADIRDPRVLDSGRCRRPALLPEHFAKAFQIAVKYRMFTSTGNKGPLFGFGKKPRVPQHRSSGLNQKNPLQPAYTAPLTRPTR